MLLSLWTAKFRLESGVMPLNKFIVLIYLVCWIPCFKAQGSSQTKAISAFPSIAFHFAGAWDCAGQFSSEKVHKALFTGAEVLARKWLELTEEDREPKTGYVAKYLIGYDPQQRRLVEFDANNFGAAIYSSTEGWKANTLTMTSPVLDDRNAPYAANRFLYSITDENTFTVDWQISKSAQLNWQQRDHLTCSRRNTR